MCGIARRAAGAGSFMTERGVTGRKKMVGGEGGRALTSDLAER